MKLSESWLREWVEINIDRDKLIEKLTMAGLEVASFEPVAADFSGVVVGEIMAIAPHPHAEKLSVCEVNVGEEETLDIVTAMTNIKPLLKLPVALEGAVLNADKTVQITTIRDVVSKGVFCSAKDLGLGDDENGVLELPADAALGDDVHHYLKLNDSMIEVELTPNRGDCLSVLGIAREVAALTSASLTFPTWEEKSSDTGTQFPIKITAEAACPRYVGRVIQGINAHARTPLWMQEKLRRCGLRSIHPVVDVTNYVMLELGQPMHAFDLTTLNRGITVRYAHQDEKIILLDDTTRELTTSDLIIADDKYPLALAGVMGGKLSCVTGTTHDIFLESAFFMPEAVAQTVRRHAIFSDSAQRFERGVDPEGTIRAMQRATELLLEIVGGKAGPIDEVQSQEHFPRPVTVQLRQPRIRKLLGRAFENDDVESILTRLGMICVEHDNGWQVQVPSHRFDVRIEEDLIEEVARVFGYDEIPTHTPTTTLTIQPRVEAHVDRQRIRAALVDRGYFEAITYSFIAPKMAQWFNADAKPIELSNPISADMAIMRASVWPGLLETLRYNLNRQIQRARLFEVGPRYFWQGDNAGQELVLAGLVAGSVEPEQWGHQAEAVDFFTVKGDIEALLNLGHQAAAYAFRPAAHLGLHPQQCAEITKQGQVVGVLGALHPALAQELDLVGMPVFLFELRLEALCEGALPTFQALSRFPAIRRDIAILVDEDVPVEKIIEKIGKNVNSLVQSVQLFDVYQGEKIVKSKKSLALGLILQHSSRTLIDEEVNDVVSQIMTMLQHEFKAVQR